MQAGDWIQSTVGIAGILATLLVARMVYKLERRDRQDEEKRTVTREREIEQRKITWTEDKDRYKSITDAFDVMQKVFDDVKRDGPLTSSQIDELGVPHAMNTLRDLSKTTSGFEQILDAVWLAGLALQKNIFPSLENFRRALSIEDKYTENLLKQMRDAARSAANQRDAAASGLAAIEMFYQSQFH